VLCIHTCFHHGQSGGPLKESPWLLADWMGERPTRMMNPFSLVPPPCPATTRRSRYPLSMGRPVRALARSCGPPPPTPSTCAGCFCGDLGLPQTLHLLVGGGGREMGFARDINRRWANGVAATLELFVGPLSARARCERACAVNTRRSDRINLLF